MLSLFKKTVRLSNGTAVNGQIFELPVEPLMPYQQSIKYLFSGTPGNRYFIDCWYGINGSTGSSNIWPFTAVPLDNRTVFLNKLSIVAQSPRMPAIFDGFWILNGKDARVNARHSKRTRSNLLFFDNSAGTFNTVQLPGVKSTNTADVRWRF